MKYGSIPGTKKIRNIHRLPILQIPIDSLMDFWGNCRLPGSAPTLLCVYSRKKFMDFKTRYL